MQRSLVFLSCGQRDGEKDLAKEVEKMIKDELKMDCYNADSVHGFDDVMSITERLAVSDYYIMIDFRRSDDRDNVPISVFTHQEFALARAWGLDRMLVFQEEGLKSHGMLQYVLAHPIPFTRGNLVGTVRDEVRKLKWETDYSRNLVASEVVPYGDLMNYGDHTGQSVERIWHLRIKNCRKDRAAVNTIAILDSYAEHPAGKVTDSPDRSPLKWVDQKDGYVNTILPQDHAAIDAFSIRVGEPGVFLHSRRDHSPRTPIVTKPGDYVFNYNVYSATFPLLKVSVLVKYTGPVQVQSTVVDTRTEARLDT